MQSKSECTQENNDDDLIAQEYIFFNLQQKNFKYMKENCKETKTQKNISTTKILHPTKKNFSQKKRLKKIGKMCIKNYK